VKLKFIEVNKLKKSKVHKIIFSSDECGVSNTEAKEKIKASQSFSITVGAPVSLSASSSLFYSSP
jgi:hypothetical protein